MKKIISSIFLFLIILLGMTNIEAKTKTTTIIVDNTINITSDTTYENTVFQRDASFKGMMFNVKNGSTLTLVDSLIDSDASVVANGTLIKVEGVLNIENSAINNYNTAALDMITIGTNGTSTNGEVNIDGLSIDNANATGQAASLFNYTNKNMTLPFVINNLELKNSVYGGVFKNIRNFGLTNSTLNQNKLTYFNVNAILNSKTISSFKLENTVFTNNTIKISGLYFDNTLESFVFDTVSFLNNNFAVSNNAFYGKGIINFDELNTSANIDQINFNKVNFSNNSFTKSPIDDSNFINATIKSPNIDFSLTNSEFKNNNITNSLVKIVGNSSGKQLNISDNEFSANSFDKSGNTHYGLVYLNKVDANLANNTFEANNTVITDTTTALQLSATKALITNNKFLNNNTNNAYDGYNHPIGGGISISGASIVDINSSLFNGNKAYYGGGVFITGKAIVNISDSEFINNIATYSGGGIFTQINTTPELTINNVQFTNNQASKNWGGGIAHLGGTLNVKKATFEDNYAYKLGGGIYTHQNTTTHYWNVFMDQNTAAEYGGSLYTCPQGSIDIRLNNSLAMFNDSANLGGDSIYAQQSTKENVINLKIAKYSLGLGKTLVYNDGPNAEDRYQLGDSPLDQYQFSDETVFLKLLMSNYDVAKARADLIFINNHSNSNGGAIATNGDITFGDYGEVSVEVIKNWDDNNDEKGNRPDSIEVALKGNDILMDTAILSKDNAYQYNFSELPKGDDNYQIDYTVEELNIDPKYEVNYDNREENKDDDGNLIGYTFNITNILNDQSEEIIPIAPTLDTNVKCDQKAKLVLPNNLDELNYTYEIENLPSGYKVVAVAKDGYTFKENVDTEWVLNYLIIPCSDEVKTIKPQLDLEIECGKHPKLITADIEGLYYEIIDTGHSYIVKAKLKDGYSFAPNQVTEWELPYFIKLCAIADKPTLNKNVKCEVNYIVEVPKNTDKVKYEVIKLDEYTIKVVAIAQSGYKFVKGTETEWIFNIKNNEKCPVSPGNSENGNDGNSGNESGSTSENVDGNSGNESGATSENIPSTGKQTLFYGLVGILASLMIFTYRRASNLK